MTPRTDAHPEASGVLRSATAPLSRAHERSGGASQSRAAAPAPLPSSPAGTGVPSGASAAPGPAPAGAVAALLAALSIAAATAFARLLAAPARWRPVLLVASVERPG